MTRRLNHEEFVKLAVEKLRTGSFKGIHSVFSGFNAAFKMYYHGEDPVRTTTRLAEEGKIVIRPSKGGVRLYLPGEDPQDDPGRTALTKMGLI
ncbi:MAG: hypothetical protein SCM96_12780 [Acidobacteriota bacterium]|nr:hypothetical protein [Acidobacteriota bacterium]